MSVTDVRRIDSWQTVILQVSTFPLEVLAVIVAVPHATAVTLPVELTFAIAALLDVHVTVSVELEGESTFESVHVLPLLIVNDGLIEMAVAGT